MWYAYSCVFVCSGADAILLIAAVLPNQDLAYFMKVRA
jgi:indole-3-glycerol phosphate synthase